MTNAISVVMTSHNEGEELHRTLRSIIRNTRELAEIIVVDDGSTDGSCDAIAARNVRVIRNNERIGVGYSRDMGSRAAQGDVLCYLDAHQRVSRGCLDRCAKIAVERKAISCPDLKDYGLFGWRLHGADFRLCPKFGFFSGAWRQWWPSRRINPVTGLRAPPYLIPRELYDSVAWSTALRGWGASEASVVVKAFFTDVGIFHFKGPLARHRFQTQFAYETTWDDVWRNQAIIARTCFDDSTWHRYWLPRVFEGHLTDDALATIEGPLVQAEHEEFLARKVRTDRQFWTELLQQPPPPID